MTLYADIREGTTDTNATIDRDELLGYIRNITDYAANPLDAVLVQIDAMGDPDLPSLEQAAILRWLGEALEDWDKHFPLEEPLSSNLRRLRPLAAALAIADPQFLTPGAHPLHQILDTVQEGAIGWQSRLGRAGQALEKQIERAVTAALAWFDEPGTDLGAIATELRLTMERDRARAGRMAQRLVETEQGKIKTATARRRAADMINSLLQKFNAPEVIGEFLTGPWYDSAQLVLLKFGEDSEQWNSMCKTTATLLDSVQPADPADEGYRQHLYELVTELPKDLKHWLISLQHDRDAINDVLDLVEFAHLRILRQQPFELIKVDPIPVAPRHPAPAGDDDYAVLQAAATGQWFSIDTGEEQPLRAQLILNLTEDQLLLFSNQAGIKVLQESYKDFAGQLTTGKAQRLHSGAGFSASLAGAAGISTVDDLTDLAGGVPGNPPESSPAAVETPVTEPTGQPEQAAAEQREREAKEQREREAAEQREREAAQQREREAAQQREREAEEQREREAAEQREREAEEQREREAEEQREREAEEQREREEAALQAKQQAIAEELRARREREAVTASVSDSDAVDPGEQEQSGESTSQPESTDEEVELQLPMGAWLGFHDGDTPLMAKLAVHDPEQNNYIFVNREGIKMRQLSKQDLLRLVDQGQVDILETRSNFRDVVTRARKKLAD